MIQYCEICGSYWAVQRGREEMLVGGGFSIMSWRQPLPDGNPDTTDPDTDIHKVEVLWDRITTPNVDTYNFMLRLKQMQIDESS